jgi:hypothetical protein
LALGRGSKEINQGNRTEKSVMSRTKEIREERSALRGKTKEKRQQTIPVHHVALGHVATLVEPRKANTASVHLSSASSAVSPVAMRISEPASVLFSAT